MVRDVVFVRVPDLLAERYADGDYRPFIGAINQLLKDTAEVTHETPEHFSLGRFSQAVPSRFELLYAAALNGPRALVATMRVLNVQQFQSLAAQEIQSLEEAIRMTMR
jgi:hypothetical protein